jgi:carbon starvation protein
MAFVLFMTIWAMVKQVFFDWMGTGQGGGFQPLLFILGVIILVFALWVIAEAFIVFSRKSKYDDFNRAV